MSVRCRCHFFNVSAAFCVLVRDKSEGAILN